MAGPISTDPTEMLLEASMYGAAPEDAIDPDTLDALLQKRRADLIAAQRQPADTFTAEDYALTNHGLQALPHIENSGD